MATATTEGLAIILSKCNRLKKLSLESCAVDAKVCLQISNNSHLEVLNMSNVEGLNEEGICYLLQSCSRYCLHRLFLYIVCLLTFVCILVLV